MKNQKIQSEPSRQDIQQLINLFQIYIDGPEGCKERSYKLFTQYPESFRLLQIVAACDSMTGNYNEAIQKYSKCLALAPNTLAYRNNIAWNLIQMKEFQKAMYQLADIKDKWYHPAIYSNWVTVLKNTGQDIQVINEANKKREQYIAAYPQYVIKENFQLIHTFLLRPEYNFTKKIEDFRSEILEIVDTLQNFLNGPLSIDFLKVQIESLQDRIAERKREENSAGMLIEPRLKIGIKGLEILDNKILKYYNQRYHVQLQKYVFKSIEIINQNLFAVDPSQLSEYSVFETNKVTPTEFQIDQIGQFMRQLYQQLTASQNPLRNPPEIINPNPQIKPQNKNQKLAQNNPDIIAQNKPQIIDKNKQNQNQQEKNQNNLNNQPVQKYPELQDQPIIRSQNPPIQEKSQRANQNINKVQIEIQNQNQLPLKQSRQNVPILHLPNNEQNPSQIHNQQPQSIINNQNHDLLIQQEDGYQFLSRQTQLQQLEQQNSQNLIQKLKVQGQNQSRPLFIILHFRSNMKDTFSVFINNKKIDHIILKQPNLPNLQRLQTLTQKVQLKRYYFVLQNILKFYNFYGTRNFVYQRKNIKSNLESWHYVELITPVLNHIFKDQEIFKDFEVGNIIHKVHSMICCYINQVKKQGDFLRSFNRMLRQIHNIIQSSENPVEELLESLLQQRSLEYCGILLNDGLLTVDGSRKYHEYYLQKMNKDRKSNLHENWLVFNISILLISMQKEEEVDNLEKGFVDCYYHSRVTQSGRNRILREFYNVNHKIPLMQRVGLEVKKIFRGVFP